MSNVALLSKLAKGAHLRCKYPKHGRLNVLKWHEGVLKRPDSAPTERMPKSALGTGSSAPCVATRC